MKLKNRIISDSISILEALKIMDSTEFRSFLVLDENKTFKGILSIGDIQRALIKNHSFSTIISEVLRPDPLVADPSTSFSEIRKTMITHRMEFIPVINKNHEVESVYFWEDLFETGTLMPVGQFDLPVIVMAGGQGTRLRPLTHVLPKPLIPIGKKTIIEEIFERFSRHGCQTFFVSLNYKADLIEYYLGQLHLPYDLTFFKEDRPMGTAGSLSLLKGKINETFFVNNCDILIEQDYSEILDYHRTNGNELTLVAALKHFPIPYGTVEAGDNGCLIRLVEKPELTFRINSGMYILEPHLLAEIPENCSTDITQLIDRIVERGGKIGVFPVSEGSWKDIGTWNDLHHQTGLSGNGSY